MISTEELKELDSKLFRHCMGFSESDNKPDGAYIQVMGLFFNMNKIKRLIEAGADVNTKGYEGDTPLHYAVRRRNIALVELLISAGADVNAKNFWGSVPLRMAVVMGDVPIAKLLISAGADVIEYIFRN